MVSIEKDNAKLSKKMTNIFLDLAFLSEEFWLILVGLHHPLHLVNMSKKGVFRSAVAVAFQNVFCSEMHQNNIVFHFLKFISDITTSKRFENIEKK